MEQKLMREPLPAEAACRDSVIDMGPDESVLILIKHCRDMKQQETRLRIVTLLLLLSCVTLFIITSRAGLRQHENSTRQGGAVELSPAYSKQERQCPAENAPTDPARLQIALRSLVQDNDVKGLYVTWDVEFGSTKDYDSEKRAIVIPTMGVYFVYLRFALNCYNGNGEENSESFYMELKRRNEGYNQTWSLMDASETVACTPQGSRTLYLGQLFDLTEGDHLRVWIKEGYKLITKSRFGAYLT